MIYHFQLDVSVSPDAICGCFGTLERRSLRGYTSSASAVIDESAIATTDVIPNAETDSSISFSVFILASSDKEHVISDVLHTLSFLPKCLLFLTTSVGVSFPFSSLSVAFLPHIVNSINQQSPVQSYASTLLCPTSLVHSSRIIEQTITTRRHLSRAMASLFGVAYLQVSSERSDQWLVGGISGYLSALYLKRIEGLNEWRVQFRNNRNWLAKHDRVGTAMSCPDATDRATVSLLPENIEADSNLFYSEPAAKVWAVKGPLVLIILEKHIGKNNMQKVHL
jgi:hypothetical protein